MDKQSDNDTHIMYFMGAKLTKRQSNIVCLSVAFGFFGIALILIFLGFQSKLVAYPILTLFVVVGFVVATKVFKKNVRKTRTP